ncbi:MAG: type II secretion system protein M [Desulfuromonadales bacterium]|nr:type II secretion system protein M [Desulfuromonadales bacterium]
MIQRLTPREKLAVAVAGAVVSLTILVAGIILPYRTALERLDQRIASRQGQLLEARTLLQRIKAMQGEVAVMQRKLSAAPAAPLVATLEGLVAEIAGKEKLLGIRPQAVTAPSGFRQEKVEMQLERVRLEQLVQLLHAIDSAKSVMQSDSLKMRPRFEDPALLDVTLVVSSFVRGS